MNLNNSHKINRRSKTVSMISLLPLLFFVWTMSGVVPFIKTAAAADITPEVCLTNTDSEPGCKDCCDCLESAEERKSCRDSCMEGSNDFSSNSNIITIEAPSVLGADYEYPDAVSESSEQDCKTYCDESDEISCGDRKYCRDACNAAFSTTEGGPDSGNSGDSNISINQAISEEAQMKTIAFTGLAFLTGDLCSDTFFPPGKVSDFFGFQYRRDITPNGFGHNTEFAGKISDYVLSILTEAQVEELVDMANDQKTLVDAYGKKRFVLIKSFFSYT